MVKPAGMAELNPHPTPPGWGQETGLGESVLFLVLAPAGTAGATLFHHGLAALVEDGLAFATPYCGVKLKGEDDVLVVADLTDEATLGTQVAMIDVLGGTFDQGLEEPFIHALRDLLEVSDTVLVGRLQEIIPVVEPLA